MPTKRTVAQVTVLARITRSVPPTANLEVGLLSIRETNSMIHPGIEGIGITVAERGGALLWMMMNLKIVSSRQEAPCLLQGMYCLVTDTTDKSNNFFSMVDDSHPLMM